MEHPRRKKVKRLRPGEERTAAGIRKLADGAQVAKEKAVSDALRTYMEAQGWKVGKLHGSLYQRGWPDLYARHPEHGERWIETKSPRGSHKLEHSQVRWCREWEPFGALIFVLRGPADYKKLFGPPNWRLFT